MSSLCQCFIFSSLLLSRFSSNFSSIVLEWNGHRSNEWFSRQKQIWLGACVSKSNLFRYMSVGSVNKKQHDLYVMALRTNNVRITIQKYHSWYFLPNHYKSCYYTYTNQQYCDSSNTCTSYLRALCLEVKTLPLLNFIPGRIQELLLHLLGKFSRFIYLFVFSSLLLSRFSSNRSATVLERNGHRSHEFFSRQKQICLCA